MKEKIIVIETEHPETLNVREENADMSVLQKRGYRVVTKINVPTVIMFRTIAK